MKKITFLLLLLVFSFQAMAQVLNQPANWPNTNWTVTGTYLPGAAFSANPTLTSNFAYDDDEAGSSAVNNIAAESPVIDLTAAFNAGETWLFLNSNYVYNNIGNDFLAIQYFNADAAEWVNWGTPITTDTPGAPLDNFCGGTSAPYNSGELNIAGFTATQLSGFKYHILYDDGGGWVWGFCFQSPTLISQLPPACPNPSGLVASNPTSEGANLAWTENGTATLYNIEIVPSGSNPTGVPTYSGVSNPYVATGLNPVTTYNFYVQAQCGGGDVSSFIGGGTFTTLCSVFTPDYIALFTTFPEDCWDEADSGTPATGPENIGASSWLGGGFANVGSSGANRINLYFNSKSDWLLSPVFDLTGGPFQVELDLAIMKYFNSTTAGVLGSDDKVQLLITNDDGATWVPLISWDNTSIVPVGGEHYVASLTSYSGQTVQFGVWASEGTVDDTADNDVSFDNFRVRAVPTCPEPTALVVSNITANTAEIAWTENGSSSLYNIEIVAAGTTPTGVATYTGVSNPYTINNLNATTSYDVYVQADCGAGEISEWVGPRTFTTLCDIYTPDYIAQFNTFLQDCWSEADSGTPITGPGNLGTGSWSGDGFANNGTTGANSINLYSNFKSDWLISPIFDLTGGPFQVELDLAIMQFFSSTTGGTLGSDDKVQLVITNDNGATWVPLISWDNTTAVPLGGDHYVANLAAYSGQIVQFGMWATDGSVVDSADNDISFDNFRVRGVPTCQEPTALTATNLSLTSTEVGWTENGSSTVWNIEYGIAGFTQGTGTLVSDVTTNPFVLENLTADTLYEFYVQSNCGGTEGLSSFNGPRSFYTGYCASVPSGNDGQGVSNVSIGALDFPSFGDVTYENHTDIPVNVFQGIQTTVAITFVTGYSYNTYIWIDFNDNLVFDTTELVYQGESTNGNPTTLDATFTMPADAPIGPHRMRVGTGDFLPNPNPCYSGTYGVTLDFTVNVIVLDCVLSEATFTPVPDCDNNQFFIEVNITSLGDATSLELSNNVNANTSQVLAPGIYPVGPFEFGTNVKVIVTNEQNSNCVINSTTLGLLGCPPSNDNCEEATVAVVNANSTCDAITPGTILAASPSGVPGGSCGNPNDDVWFQFTALNDIELISLINISGGTSFLNHALYSGTCGALTEIACSAENASVTPLLVVGDIYYLRVFSSGSQEETSTFDLCIKQAPSNLVCENSVNFCGNDGALTTSNIIGIPSAGAIACLSTAPNPTWNILQIGDSGQIDIQITQNSEFDADGNPIGNQQDVDYVIWGPFTSLADACGNLTFGCPNPSDCPGLPYTPEFYPYGNIIDCSYSVFAVETLTIDNAVEGEIYVLLVTNFSDDPGIIQIKQTNSGETGAGSTVAEIQVDLGGNQDLCGFDNVVLTADSPFADSYEWYADGFIIEGETGPTLTVTESNIYTVIAYDDQCGSNAQDEVTIVFGAEPVANEVPNIVTCDDISGDGFETFDLEAQTAGILGTQDASMFNVTYYLSQSDANTGTGSLTSPYTNISNPQTIYVRVEDANATFCTATTSFDLSISGVTPTATSADISFCDDASRDGEMAFVLTDNDVNILNGQSAADYTVSYYASEADANAATTPLISPYTNTSSPQTIWARVDNVNAVDCYAIVDFDLIVDALPLTTFATDIDYEVCPNASEPIIITANPQNYNAGEVSIVWTKAGVVIPGETSLTLPVLTGGLYEIQVTFTETGCPADPVGITVIQLENCKIPQGISPNGDGKNDTFDLRSFSVQRIEIFNRLGKMVYSKDNYKDEWHGQTNSGDELPVGTYFYTMLYEGGAKTKSSWVYINK